MEDNSNIKIDEESVTIDGIGNFCYEVKIVSGLDPNHIKHKFMIKTI